MPNVERSQQVLNTDTFERLRDLNEPGAGDVLGELIGLYLADAPKLMDDLRQALAQRNASNLWQVAHTLKGSSGNLGAETLAEVCQDLEFRCKSGRLNEVGALVDRLEREFLEVRKALIAEQS